MQNLLELIYSFQEDLDGLFLAQLLLLLLLLLLLHHLEIGCPLSNCAFFRVFEVKVDASSD